MPPQIDQPIERGEKNDRKSARVKHIRACPQSLIQRKPEAPKPADNKERAARLEKSPCLLPGFLLVLQERADDNADQRRRDRRHGREQAFGIDDGRLAPDVVRAEYKSIDV